MGFRILVAGILLSLIPGWAFANANVLVTGLWGALRPRNA